MISILARERKLLNGAIKYQTCPSEPILQTFYIMNIFCTFPPGWKFPIGHSIPYISYTCVHVAGELHLPNQLCGPFIKKELAYWGIDDNLIQPCCWSKYKDFEESELLLRQVNKPLFVTLFSLQAFLVQAIKI